MTAEILIDHIYRRHGDGDVAAGMCRAFHEARKLPTMSSGRRVKMVALPRHRYVPADHYLLLDGELESDREIITGFVEHVQGYQSPHADLSTTPIDQVVLVIALAA